MDKAISFSDDLPLSTLADRARRGDLVRLAPGVYTSEVTSPPERVVRDHLDEIVGHLFPDAVITDRSAPTMMPVNGVLYLAHDRRDREVTLPGLVVSARSGARPQSDDIPRNKDGLLFMASEARSLAENSEPSRARKRGVPRRLTRHELGEWVERLCRLRGEETLNKLRDRARELAKDLGVRQSSIEVLDELIGTALGTREAKDIPRVLRARRYGHPYDPARTELFDRLVSALRGAAPQVRQEPSEDGYLPFFEAYFSNYIEGTEFTVEEASAIVFEDFMPQGRSEDAHDILGTYHIVSDREEMSLVPGSPEELRELLLRRHAVVMAGRPDKTPGVFKSRANQAGATLFVAPPLVEGTLTEAYARRSDLDTAFERAVYTMFVVAEVHPFDDGNGRVARIMMNAELVAAGQSRIIVPTAFRSDYVGALRRLSRQDDPSVLIKALRYVQDWTAGIDFSDFAGARSKMDATNAFEDPESGLPLQLPANAARSYAGPAVDSAPARSGGGVDVSEYTRGDGTKVRSHRRRRPS